MDLEEAVKIFKQEYISCSKKIIKYDYYSQTLSSFFSRYSKMLKEHLILLNSKDRIKYIDVVLLFVDEQMKIEPETEYYYNEYYYYDHNGEEVNAPEYYDADERTVFYDQLNQSLRLVKLEEYDTDAYERLKEKNISFHKQVRLYLEDARNKAQKEIANTANQPAEISTNSTQTVSRKEPAKISVNRLTDVIRIYSAMQKANIIETNIEADVFAGMHYEQDKIDDARMKSINTSFTNALEQKSQSPAIINNFIMELIKLTHGNNISVKKMNKFIMELIKLCYNENNMNDLDRLQADLEKLQEDIDKYKADNPTSEYNK